MIGQYVAGYSQKYCMTQVYLVVLSDSDNVIVANIRDPRDVKALSPRAISRTFHEVHKRKDGRWNCPQWSTWYNPEQVEPLPVDGEELEAPAYEGLDFLLKVLQTIVELKWSRYVVDLQTRIAELGAAVG